MMGYIGVFPFTSDYKKPYKNSVASLEMIKLGNLEQWVLIRGRDKSNPVLLWLHGGPGDPLMPFAHYIDKKLEKEFVVVHWDQRGAGKTNNFGGTIENISFDQMKKDASQLIHHISNRFKKRKIFLIGHSWGSYLGLHLIKNYPEKFHAYIGVGQVVDNYRSQKISYDWLLQNIYKKNISKFANKLKQIGDPPYLYQDNYNEFLDLVDESGGLYSGSKLRLYFIATRASEYNIIDYIKWLKGRNHGSKKLWKEIWGSQFNFEETLNYFDVPVYFINGANDYYTPLSLVKEYFETVEAPDKEIYIFEEAAHLPFISESNKFSELIVNIKGKIIN